VGRLVAGLALGGLAVYLRHQADGPATALPVAPEGAAAVFGGAGCLWRSTVATADAPGRGRDLPIINARPAPALPRAEQFEERTYIDTGKVRLVFFGLTLGAQHRNAMPAAQAALRG